MNEYIDPLRDDAAVPLDLFLNKYIETDFPVPDVDGYQRELLSNVGVEDATFEHEKRRDSKSFDQHLKLRYDGHRGSATVYTEGQFTGILGSANPAAEGYDPRPASGVSDPDMKQLNKQERARMRFIRFTAENDNKITGGSRAEARAIADRVSMDRAMASRMKIFDRQIESMNPGRLLAPSNVAAITMTSRDKRFDDQDQQTTIVGVGGHRPGDILYREAVSDQDFAIAYYGDMSRKRRMHAAQTGNAAQLVDVDIGIDMTRMTIHRAASLMKNISRGSTKDSLGSSVDAEFQTSTDAANRSHGKLKAELFTLLASVADQSFGAHTTSAARKHGRSDTTTGTRVENFVSDHIIDVFNAEMIKKGLKPGANTAAIKANIQYMQDATDSGTSAIRKAADKKSSRAGTGTIIDSEFNDSTKSIALYKTRASRGLPELMKLTSAEKFGLDSDHSRIALTLKKQIRRADNDETVSTQKFLDNEKLERHGGRLGSKNTRRFQDEEHGISEGVI
jgi:hypothetical protein